MINYDYIYLYIYIILYTHYIIPTSWYSKKTEPRHFLNSPWSLSRVPHQRRHKWPGPGGRCSPACPDLAGQGHAEDSRFATGETHEVLMGPGWENVENSSNCNWLVRFCEPTLLKKYEDASIGMMTFPTEWKKTNGPNHQPGRESGVSSMQCWFPGGELDIKTNQKRWDFTINKRDLK